MNLDLGDTRLIIETCKRHGCLRNQAAYILATGYHETARKMKPVREALAVSDAGAMSRLENAWKAGRLKWVKRPYWRGGFFGRGYVQLTHKSNYQHAGRKLGLPLETQPSLALEPEHAALILVRGSMEGWFTGRKLGDYITLHKSDFFNARRVINGRDRAGDIARLAKEYDVELKVIHYGSTDATPIPVPVAKPKIYKNLAVSKETLLGATGLITAVTAFFEQIDGSILAPVLAGLALGVIANRLWARFREER